MPSSLIIDVLLLFWQTSWFIGSAGGLVALTGWSIHQQRLSRVRQEEAWRARRYESELKLLKSQMGPHFLFNSLNNIHSLCILEPQKASHLVMNLSKMLRYTLYECQGDCVLLHKELDFLRQYVQMQREKNNQQHDIRFAVEGHPAQRKIVPFLLTNFIENSFKHADVSINPRGFVCIKIAMGEQGLVLTARNTFQRRKPDPAYTGGLGMAHARRRLQIFYPNRGGGGGTNYASGNKTKFMRYKSR